MPSASGPRRPPAPCERALDLLERARKAARRLDSSDPEAVHDFRTAARRLRTELWLNRGLLKRRPGARARRRLGKLVRATGRARDAEAGRELLAKENGPGERSLRRVLAGEARLPRTAAKRLRRKFRQAVGELKRCLRKEPVDLDRTDALRRLRRTRRKLPEILRRALETRRQELLHEARKQARKLRYAEESLFPRRSRDLKRVQDALGRERDLYVLAARARQEGLAGLEKRLRAQRDIVLESIRGAGPSGTIVRRILGRKARTTRGGRPLE